MRVHRWASLPAAAVLAAGLNGCSAGMTPDHIDTTSGKVTKPTSLSTAGPPIRSPDPSGADPGAMGIEIVEWPDDLAGAQRLLDRMPDVLAGLPARRSPYGTGRDPIQEMMVMVVYGPDYRGMSAWASDGGPALDARATLATRFSLYTAYDRGNSCSRTSYAGTAKPVPANDGVSPGTGQDEPPGEKLWWFSCTITGPRSDPLFHAYAVGWVDGELAWLTVGRDKAMVRTIIDAMRHV